MKTIYPIIVLAAAALASLAPAGPAPIIAGRPEVAVQGVSQNLIYQEIRVRTNKVGVIKTYKSTTTNFTVNAGTLMALLENSFHTNFPPGCQLLLEKQGAPFYAFVVSDTTGTNLGFNPSAVLSSSFLTGAAYEFSGNQTKDVTTGTYKDAESYTTALTFTYDDVGMNTTDGTHASFRWVGLVHDKSVVSGTASSAVNSDIVTIEVVGSGSFNVEQPGAIFTGSIRAKVSGP